MENSAHSLELDKFYLEKVVKAIAIKYQTVEIIFRRSFPFGYPGTDGQRRIFHTWKIKSGSTYYSYSVCRNCFDVRKLQSQHPPEKVVQTCLCAPCGVDPLKSRNYWDGIYTTLCTCPILGERFEHCMEWKLSRLGIYSKLLKVGYVQRGNQISQGLRDSGQVEQISSGSESDTSSYDV